MLSKDQIKQQSIAAYSQWATKWREHSAIHSKYPMRSLEDLRNIGVGKPLVLVANGASFEEEKDILIKYRHNVDIFCCDKTLGALLKLGITPDYCMVCDASVDYEVYMKPYEDQLKDTILFNNICGNPQWSKLDKWKSIYFFANEDVLGSEKEFMGLSGCPNVIAAGTNVSNAMLILVTQCSNKGRQVFMGYDKIILLGYDYSWEFGKNYYAFSKDGDGKTNYMRHEMVVNNRGEYAFTSNNLLFSCKWIVKYLSAFNLPVVNCSKSTILSTKYKGDLADHMQYAYKQEDKDIVKELIDLRTNLMSKLSKIENRLKDTGKDHFMAFMKSV